MFTIFHEEMTQTFTSVGEILTLTHDRESLLLLLSKTKILLPLNKKNIYF